MHMSILGWTFVILGGIMIIGLGESKRMGSILPSETMVFDLYSDLDCSGPRQSYAFEMTQSEPQNLFRASDKGRPLSVKSVRINRAEGGAVISLFHEEEDQKPAFTIAFSIDIHEPVCIGDVSKSSFARNVQIVWSRPESASLPPMTFKKITVDKPLPHFVVFNSK